MKDSIFKEKKIIKKKDLKKTCESIDETTELIPLYFEPVFKKIFQDHRLLKNFLIAELNLDKELKNQHVYYGNSVLLNKYGPFVTKTSIIVKVCNNRPLIITFADIDYKKTYLQNRIIEFTINYRDKKKRNVKIINKTKEEMKYYRKLYDRKIKLKRNNLLLVALTSKSFQELYEIISRIFDEDDTNNLIRAAIKTSKNKIIIKGWSLYRNKI